MPVNLIFLLLMNCVLSICSANPKASQMEFKMATKYNMKMYYCSASDGTNVVKV